MILNFFMNLKIESVQQILGESNSVRFVITARRHIVELLSLFIPSISDKTYH